MDQDWIHKLQYSYAEERETHPLPLPLKDSLQLIWEFFKYNTTNKLCIVFPSKEYSAQWISIPIALSLIESDYNHFKDEITGSYQQYKPGDKLMLNNKAIVEWVGVRKKTFEGPTFRTKDTRGLRTEITIRFCDVMMLRRAPKHRKALSSSKTAYAAAPSQSEKNITPIDDLLRIEAYGNKEFIKHSVCLVSKLKSYNDAIDGISLNSFAIRDYFREGIINDNGNAEESGSLLISNNFTNLVLHLSQLNNIAMILIDGYSAIGERGTDFSDIDALNLPTILFTDLSEIETFENIGKYGFEFFNFTKDNIRLGTTLTNSPFHLFERKLKNFINFDLRKECCHNSELETITEMIYSIEKDELNNDLKNLKIPLIQLTNLVSRIAHIPMADEIENFNLKIVTIESMLNQSRFWLGESYNPIQKAVIQLKSVFEKYSSSPSEKCVRLNELLNVNFYDYIICATEAEKNALNRYLYNAPTKHTPQVISVADVTDNLSVNKPVRAVLTGWAKSNNMNRIFSSFIFKELTILFYQFENKYYNSLQQRNRTHCEIIKPTINLNGIHLNEESKQLNGFDNFYSDRGLVETVPEKEFDIIDFEQKLDTAQYSKYSAKGNLIESIKAKRIDFDSDLFFYTTESHKLLVINELIERKGEAASIYRKKVESLKAGDIIALINTDRDILVELVEKNTSSEELVSVTKWTELWKNLLKDYYAAVGYNFTLVINGLRINGCKKHEMTIRTWLQDESRIGPDDNADLISIALLTNSNLLNDNIITVRKAISKMKGWRMKASDFIIDKITSKIHEFAESSIINKNISVEGLGTVIVLKIIDISNVWENIDVRYVNRLLKKDII
jgi:hypothetical protein